MAELDRILWNDTDIIPSSEITRMAESIKDDWRQILPKKVSMTEQTLEPKQWAISNGGPSTYYDFPAEWTTLNDYIEHKSIHQWKEHSFHLGNITKAGCRWGDKHGTTKGYDARKISYSGLRLLLMVEGKTAVKEYLMELLNDEQFN